MKGVLMDPCDRDYSCNLDANIFKGIFARNLRYLMDVTHNKTQLGIYKRFLKTNILSLEQNASCQPGQATKCHIVYLDGAPSYPATGPVYDSVWRGPFNQSRPIQQTSALDLLLAGVEADSGSWLSYTWGQAKHAGREAGNALYKGVKELACLQVRGCPGEYLGNQESCVQVECCSPSWRPANSSQLEQLLAGQLVGQHLAHQLVTGAVRGHLARHTHSKPLVMR